MRLLDTQKYAECQLVAVINAATFLGEPRVEPNSEEYERLVDLAGARCGSASTFGIRAVTTYLRLIQNDITPITLDGVRMKVMSGHPVHVYIQHPALGFHAVLLTDGDGHGVHVSNMYRKEFRKERLTWRRLRELMGGVPAHCRRAYWYELDPLRIRENEKNK